MQKNKEKRFTLETKSGCKRLLALLIAVILISSFFAALISSDFGNVKITHVVLDARGGIYSADLYVPAGVSDANKIPAVLVSHGRGVVKGVMKGFAEEIARRGYVVLNVDAYGAGLSEQPVSDDNKQGAAGFNIDNTPQGLLDALNFVRSLKYVDATRVGITGHSMGTRRAGYTAMLDSGYFTFNDVMVNVLYNTFSVKLTQDDINKDADALAKTYLPADKLDYYNYLKSENLSSYNTRLKTIGLVGSNANLVGPTKSVTVANYKVTRTCKVNIGIINGQWDFSYGTYNKTDAAKKAWYTGGKDIQMESWYSLDDAKQSSEILGGFSSISITSNAKLKDAISKCTARICMVNPNESHSKNFFSAQSTSDVIKYFEQTLNYNKGNLTDSSTKPLDAGNIVFQLRAVFNCIAMLAMLALAFPIAGMLRKEKNLSGDTGLTESDGSNYKKLTYWIFAAVTVAVTFYAVYTANAANASPVAPRILPGILRLISTSYCGVNFILYIGAISFVLLACFIVMGGKKTTGKTGLKPLNIALKFTDIMKYLAVALGIVALCYISLLTIEYLFNQDYRLWMTSFTDMKVEYWGVAAAYALIFLPCYLLNGAAVNYAVRRDIPEWKDTLITIAVNAAGVWICCLVNLLVMSSSGKGFSMFTCSYQLVLLVPATLFITRKMYNITKSIWLGAFLNAMLIAWATVSSTGINDKFYAQGFFSIFFGV